jgi:hypothetical protein
MDPAHKRGKNRLVERLFAAPAFSAGGADSISFIGDPMLIPYGNSARAASYSIDRRLGITAQDPRPLRQPCACPLKARIRGKSVIQVGCLHKEKEKGES